MAIHLQLFMQKFFQTGILVVFMLGYTPSPAQQKQVFPTEDILSCLHEIYSNDFSAVGEACDLPKEYVHIQGLLDVFSQRWKEVPIHLSSRKELYLKKLEKIVVQFDNVETADPVTMYLRIATQLLLAEYHFANHDFLQALWYGKKAYPLIIQSMDEERTEPEYLFVKGLYFYYIEYYREKSFFYRSALLPFRDGDKKEAIKLLIKSVEDESLAQTESLIYLAHINLRLENKPDEALVYAKRLWESYPINLKFKELYIENLLAAKKYEECYPLLQEQLASGNLYYTIPALYALGCYYQDYKMDAEKAHVSFNKCIELVEKHDLLHGYKIRAKQKIRTIN